MAEIVGEWFTDHTDEVCATLNVGNAIGAVVVIAQVNPLGELNDETARAHGKLIAAAPALLKAAERALNVLKAQGEAVLPKNVLGALDAAIAKAKP